MLKKINDSAFSIIQEIVGKSSLPILQLKKDWENIVPSMFKNSQPLELKPIIKSSKKNIIIGVKSNAQSMLLSYEKKDLIDKLNIYFGENKIENIIFKVIK